MPPCSSSGEEPNNSGSTSDDERDQQVFVYKELSAIRKSIKASLPHHSTGLYFCLLVLPLIFILLFPLSTHAHIRNNLGSNKRGVLNWKIGLPSCKS